MVYSIFYLLFPIWILYQKNRKTEIYNSYSNSETILDINKDNSNLINRNRSKYDGFDLSINQTKQYNKEQNKLQQIIIHFRNLHLLNYLQSPFVSEIEKLKCAEEILLDDDFIKKKENNNHFWETFEDVFF